MEDIVKDYLVAAGVRPTDVIYNMMKVSDPRVDLVDLLCGFMVYCSDDEM